MILFWIVAGLLMAGALLFVLPPLLGRRAISGGATHGQANLNIYRDQLRELELDLAQGTIDQDHYDAARADIERRVIEESGDGEATIAPAQAQWTLVSLIGILLPALAIGVYVVVGTPEALTAQPQAAVAQGDQGHAVTDEQIQAMVARLAERLQQNPEDGEGWLMLAKSYSAMGRFGESVKAYGEAARRLPPDAQLLADYADAVAMSQGRNLLGEPETLVAQALKIDPENVKALAISGTIAYTKKDYKAAAAAWRKVLAVVPPDSEFAQRMQASVEEAESLASGTRPGKPVAAAGASLRGRVSLSDAARKTLTPQDTVFIFARAAEGPRMPVAILRTQVSALPSAFTLDDSMGVMGGARLSQVSELVVGARVSRSGSATPSPGDWESALVKVAPGAENIALNIDRQITN